MDTARISEIKKELARCSQEELVGICLRLASHKKETKELLHYLIFESVNEAAFIDSVKRELEEDFKEVNTSHIYRAKVRIRKILKKVNKYIRFSRSKRTEVELRLYFCQQVINSRVKIRQNRVLFNMVDRQADAIQKALDKLHPDFTVGLPGGDHRIK